MVTKNTRHSEHCPFAELINTTSKPQNEEHLERRVGRIEGVVDSLCKDVQQIVKSVNEMSVGLNEFKENVANRMVQASRPQWPLIVSITSLLLTLVIMGGSLIAFVMSGQGASIQENKNNIAINTSKLYQNQYEQGKNDIWHKQTDDAMNKLDVKIQKEMSLINTTVEAKLIALDDKLQKEFSGLNKVLDMEIQNSKKALDNLHVWQLETTKNVGKMENNHIK